MNVKETIHRSSVVFDEGCKVGFVQFAIQSETLLVHRLLEGARSKDGLVVFSINVCHNKWNEMMLYNLTTSGVQEGKTTILGINFNLLKIYAYVRTNSSYAIVHIYHSINTNFTYLCSSLLFIIILGDKYVGRKHTFSSNRHNLKI